MICISDVKMQLDSISALFSIVTPSYMLIKMMVMFEQQVDF
jgi:predicted tellurium resistance membrane protein TerC